MFRYLFLLAATQSFAGTAFAHEFWIEPKGLLIPEGGKMEAVLMIGEHPEGQEYAFQPQAYAQAIWAGPNGQIELSRLPLSAPEPSFNAVVPGLHSLSVATYPQKLTYASMDELRKFLAESGQKGLISSGVYNVPADGKIRETYRRYSKTLVHFAKRVGKDRRVGLQREWVWEDDVFRLYKRGRPHPGQKTTVSCSIGPFPVTATRIVLHTDKSGAINPILPPKGRCLINTIIVDYDSQADQWRSDWVSLYFRSP